MSDLAMKIAEIETWDRDECMKAWSKLTGQPLGAKLSTRFLRCALAFELQRKKLGGVSTSVKRLLRAEATGHGLRKTKPLTTLTSGTQLVREWNGRIYRVDVKADGFEMDGQNYASLSAVAKRITGAQWSGPRFFGLKKPAA